MLQRARTGSAARLDELMTARLDAEVESLPPQVGRCLRLWIDGQSPAEIAVLLRIREDTAEAHLLAARRRLDGLLSGEGAVLP